MNQQISTLLILARLHNQDYIIKKTLKMDVSA